MTVARRLVDNLNPDIVDIAPSRSSLWNSPGNTAVPHYYRSGAARAIRHVVTAVASP
jgi:hypothetical protein